MKNNGTPFAKTIIEHTLLKDKTMKTLRNIVPIIALLLAGLTGMAKEKQKADTAAFNKMVQLVNSKNFYIHVDAAVPMGNGSITVDTKYGSKRLGGEGYVSLANNEGELFIMDTVVTGHMPFFGRAYNIPYGDGGGMEFSKTKLEKESIKVFQKKKKQYVEYEFTVRKDGDVINFRVEIYANGKCSVNVNSNNRASISYSGDVTAIPEDKKPYLK